MTPWPNCFPYGQKRKLIAFTNRAPFAGAAKLCLTTEIVNGIFSIRYLGRDSVQEENEMSYETLRQEILNFYFEALLSYGQSCCAENQPDEL